MSRRVVSALSLALVLAALSTGCTAIRSRIWMNAGNKLYKAQKYADKSVAGFEKLLKLQAPDADTAEKVRNYYIAILRSADKTDKAIAYYKELLSSEPRNTSYMAQLAEIYAKKGDVPNALEYYEKRAEVDPTNKEAWYTIGVVCWEQVHKMGPTLSDEERTATIARGLKAMEKALAL